MASDYVFSYAEFEHLVRHFAVTVPQLLLQHPATAELAFTLERLQLAEALNLRFTVAIVGQMRVGKSTLLNALIGRKLAPTGVTETTATVNWFRYGTGELCQIFRVYWADGSTEDVPLHRVREWIGTEEQAQRTRSLDFFADTPFLQMANIVDTPGTRSVLECHEKAVQGFLAEKLEAETLQYGGRADAVVYAINPVGHAADRDLLQLFGERTRLPGASAYNSIAVVQKWEHLDPDPLAEVCRKCERLRDQLQGQVAEVLPTSGLLATACMDVPPDTWSLLARLATASSPDAVDDLCLSPDFFHDDISGAALDCQLRADLATRMAWPALRFALRYAQRHAMDDGAALRQAMWEASGIERLQSVLQRRFFSLASLIQASTVLRKAWDPCNVALLTLRDLAERRLADQALANRAVDILRRMSEAAITLAPVQDYVMRSLSSAADELKQVEALRRDLDQIKYQAETNFRLLDADITCLKVLETLAGAEMAEEEKATLYRLFGGAGPEVWARLGLLFTPDWHDQALDRAWELHDHWTQRRTRASGELRRLCEHAITRVESIMNVLEESAHA